MTFIKLAALLALLGTSAPASSNELTIQELTPTLVAFRQAVIADPQMAFLRYATAEAAGRLRNLGDSLCPLSDRNAGWQFFFSTSIGSMTSLTEKTALTMLYCPWADVALLLEWNKVGGSPKISAAELVLGDFLRKTKDPALLPLWRRPEMTVPPHLAIVVAASDTVKAFLAMYGKPAVFKAADWRSKLPIVKKENQRLNQTGVGILFAQAMTSINTFFTDPTLSPLKAEMEKIRQMLIDGRTSDVLAMAPLTSSESRQILNELPLDWRQGSLMSVAIAGKDAFVFIADNNFPEYFACFWFELSIDGKQAALQRIDFMGHTLGFDQIDALARQAGMKR